MTRIRHMILACLLTGSALSVAPAQATPRSAQEEPQQSVQEPVYALRSDFNTSSERRPVSRYAQQRAQRISASQAKSIALNRVRGAKFINVQLVGDAYRVRLQQKNGRIVDVYVDARTGRVRN